MPRRVALGSLVVAAVALGVGCARRHDRVEIVGLVVATPPAPPAGEVREPLPPIPGLGVEPDTRDGSVLVAVDRRAFWMDHGRAFTAWSPPPTPWRDAAYDRLRALREQLAAVRAALAALTATDDAGRPALPPREWAQLCLRVLALGQRLEAYLAVERDDAAPLDGAAVAARLADAQWRGVRPAADDAAAAVFAAADAATAHGDAATAHAADVARGAVRALADAATSRDAAVLLPRLRLACAALGDLEADPGVVHALASEAPRARAAGATSLADALAAARRALGACAARWLANRADEIDPQPRPTLVYERPATMD